MKRYLQYLCILLALISCGKLTAQERKLRLMLPDKEVSYDVNSAYTRSLSDIIGDATEKMGDDTITEKVGKGLVTYTTQTLIGFWGHEFAHSYGAVNDNHYQQMRLDWDDRIFGVFPKAQFTPDKRDGQSKEVVFTSWSAGLNQQELTARDHYHDHQGTLTLDQAWFWLYNKVEDSRYSFGVGNKGSGLMEMPVWWRQSGKVVTLRPVRDEDPDVIQAFWEHDQLGLGRGEKEMQRRALIADLLTWRTYQSLSAIYSSLSTQTHFFNNSFRIAGHSVRPPYISTFYTLDGVFYDTETDIDNVTVTYGQNPDKKSDYRLGFRLNEIDVSERLRLSPMVYWNHIDGEDGWHIGLELEIPILDNVDLEVNSQWTDNDLIQNEVKRLEKGVRTDIGVVIRW